MRTLYVSGEQRQRTNATNLSTRKTGAKKMAAQRAAKFREETPRKGGGFAIGRDRNTALQQYDGKTGSAQEAKHTLRNFSPRKPGKIQSLSGFAPKPLPPAASCAAQ